MTEFKNCPRCGSEDVIEFYCGKCGSNKRWHYVTCEDCGVKTDNCATEEEAIEVWNRRIKQND